MSILETILLGLVQALTEFLPVSSSGHLVLAQKLLHIDQSGDAAFEVAVHMGTLMSILVVLRQEIRSLILGVFSKAHRTQSWLEETKFILISALPAGIIGVLFKNELEHAFSNMKGVGSALIFTGLLLLSTRTRRGERTQLKLSDSVWIGLAQALAILPGISRSGSTIAIGLWLGIKRERVARLSFLMSLPVIGGAGLLKALDLMKTPINSEQVMSLGIGAFSAFFFGMFALSTMLKWISRPSFAYFGLYCLLAGGLALFF